MGAFLDDQDRYAVLRAARLAAEGRSEPTLEQRQAAAKAAADATRDRLDRHESAIAAPEAARDRHPAGKGLPAPTEDATEFETPWHVGMLDAAVRGALRGFLRRIGGAR